MFNNSEPKVVPFDTCLGADISGIDISQELSPEIIDFIQVAFDEYLVLRFRDQHVTASDLVASSRKFGKLDETNNGLNDPEIYTVSNVIENGVPIGNLGDGEVYWHTDMDFVHNPPKVTMLYACEIPDTGGNTYFANMYAAYDALPDDVKEMAIPVLGHRVIVPPSSRMRGVTGRMIVEAALEEIQVPGVRAGYQTPTG